MLKSIVGRTIREVTTLSDKEAIQMFGYKCWVPVLVLDDGSIVVFMQDPEGNGPGSGLWIGPDGKDQMLAGTLSTPAQEASR